MYDIKLQYPVDMTKCTITQRFGENSSDYSKYGINGHNGLDIGSYGGVEVPIHSVGRGVVTVAIFDNTGYGWRVDVVHTWGRSLYGHMKVLHVKQGQEVNAGDLLGIMDSTGNSSGTHLHLGIYPKGEPTYNGYNGAVDPMPYLTDTIPNDDDDVIVELPKLPAKMILTGFPSIRLMPKRTENIVGHMKVGNEVNVVEFIKDDADGIVWTKVELYVAYSQLGNVFMKTKE